MGTFHYSPFHIRVSTDLKLNALLSQQGLECSIQKLFAFIRPYTDGESAHRFRILREYRTECRADGCARLCLQQYDMYLLREDIEHAQQILISMIVLAERPHIH